MITSLTRIGNSKGIIIPSHLLKMCGFENKVSLSIEDHSLVISPVDKPRAGWQESFARANAQRETDEDHFEALSNAFDEDEWQW